MTSLTISLKNKRIGFSVFDKLTFSDNALPFGDVLSANHIRDLFEEQGVGPSISVLARICRFDNLQSMPRKPRIEYAGTTEGHP